MFSCVAANFIVNPWKSVLTDIIKIDSDAEIQALESGVWKDYLEQLSAESITETLGLN